jgi:hypothetical protein
MENTNNKLLFVEHPFKKGVQVNLYPLFEKLEDFSNEAGGKENAFDSVSDWLSNHLELVNVQLIGYAKDNMTADEMSNMYFGLYKLKHIFAGLQEIKT